MKIKVLVATHKKFPMPSDSDLYMPILVGAVKNYNKGIKYQRDDEGENISIKNPNYNELTAMVDLDLDYIKQSSFLFDVVILFKTVKIVIIPNDAY